MVCKIKRAVVLEPGGSPPGVREKGLFGSLVGALFRGQGAWRALEKQPEALWNTLGLFQGSVVFLEAETGGMQLYRRLWSL